MRLRQPHQRLLQLAHLPLNPVNLFSQIKARVEGHLIVAARRGMELARERPDLIEQEPLDFGVDVLRARIKRELPAAQPHPHLLQPRLDLARLFLGENPAPAEHADVRDAPLQIVLGQPLIERQGLRELPRQLIRVLREASAPKAHAQSSLSRRTNSAICADIPQIWMKPLEAA